MTDADRAVLTLAAAHYRSEGHRLDAARSTLGLGAVAFYDQVNRLLSDPTAEAEMPVEVHRLRRVREARLVHRYRRRVA